MRISGDDLFLQLGSQKLYRTRHDRIGTNVSRLGNLQDPHWIPWAGHKPHVLKDKTQAIDMRSGIGYATNTHHLQGQSNTPIVLPATPRSYLYRHWEMWPGALTRHDAGFDVIRKLTNDGRYLYDFYYFPAEYISYKMDAELEDTPVQITLADTADRQLIIPEVPAESRRYLSYDVHGKDATYQLSLNACAGIQLKDQDSAHPSQWILDASALGDGIDLQFTDDGIRLHHIPIRVPEDSPRGQLTIIGRKADAALQQWTLDWATKNVGLSNLCVSETQTNATLQANLEKLTQQHTLPSDQVVVDHFVEDGSSGRISIRADYDLKAKQLLYTHPSTSSIQSTEEALLYHNTTSAYFEVQGEQRVQSWWGRADGRIIKPNGAMFSQPIPAAKRANSTASRIPMADDGVIWAGTDGQGEQEEAYFYLTKEKALYRQSLHNAPASGLRQIMLANKNVSE